MLMAETGIVKDAKGGENEWIDDREEGPYMIGF
jgi:hypothetical protein